MEKKLKILFVEDNEMFVSVIKEGLIACGYEVKTAFSGAEAKKCFINEKEKFDLIILDLNLPDIHGFELLKYFIEQDNTIRVLILTGDNEVESVVKGLGLGASDYLTKPFNFEELKARVMSLLRRNVCINKINDTYTFNQVSFNTITSMLTVGEKSISFTDMENKIFTYFLSNPDRIIEVNEIVNHNWSENEIDNKEYDKAARVHIHNIKVKLIQLLGFSPIMVKYNQGYVFSTDELNKHASSMSNN